MTEKLLTLETYSFRIMQLHYAGNSINIGHVCTCKRN